MVCKWWLLAVIVVVDDGEMARSLGSVDRGGVESGGMNNFYDQLFG